MGVVGAWAGLLLRHRHAPFAKQRLANIGLIVVIQIAFDLSTPQISMPAHMCGLVAGFFSGSFSRRAVTGGADPAELTSMSNSKICEWNDPHLPDEVFLINCGSVRQGSRMVIQRICILAAEVIALGYRTR